MPRQARSVTFENLAQKFLCGTIAVEGYDAFIRIFDFVATRFKLDNGATNSIEEVEGFETGDHQRHAEPFGQGRIFPVAHDAAYVPRQQKCLHLIAWSRQNGLDRRGHQDVRNQHGKILQSAPFRQVDAHGVRRRGSFKSNPEEDDLLVGKLHGQLYGVQGGVDDAHVAATTLHLEEIALGTRNAQHIAKAAENDSRLCGDGQRLVNEFERRDADRASGPVDHFDAGGQHLVDPILDDGVGLAAADFHDLPRLCGDLGDFARHALSDFAVAKLSQILHWRPDSLRCLGASLSFR